MLKEGGMLYKIWKNYSIPIYLQIYMFNLSNPDEFKNGQKPSVVQTGPYTYRFLQFLAVEGRKCFI